MFICIYPIVKSGKLFIPVSFNTIFLSIGNLGFTAFCLIKFRPAQVSIIMRAGLWSRSAHIIIDEIVLGLETLIFMTSWSLEVDASGSCLMLSSVHPYWGGRLSFPALRLLFISSNITICYNMSWFFTIIAYAFWFLRIILIRYT